ncbi:head-tail adaptor protein [uncultured Selenomonas sp.]|uniref:head-tail adaptor protein n=1 Tax=uncultured Selenomonas sp. TaxID=159275 RepID=UPI0028D40689|nr:head-tail adaptor protein [uncultured Selenomonas sp.]
MIRAGRLNRRIDIMRPIYGEDDGFGATTGYERVARVWAEFLRPRFTQTDSMGSGVTTEITQGIRIRARDIGKGWRVRHGLNEFYVLHVDDSTPGEIILTTKGVDPGG